MFGTNKLCMKGIYLPSFQRSIILRENEGYKNVHSYLHSFTTFRGKHLFHYLCIYIYNIQILYRFFSIISLDETSRHCGYTHAQISADYSLFQSYIFQAALLKSD